MAAMCSAGPRLGQGPRRDGTGVGERRGDAGRDGVKRRSGGRGAACLRRGVQCRQR